MSIKHIFIIQPKQTHTIMCHHYLNSVFLRFSLSFYLLYQTVYKYKSILLSDLVGLMMIYFMLRLFIHFDIFIYIYTFKRTMFLAECIVLLIKFFPFFFFCEYFYTTVVIHLSLTSRLCVFVVAANVKRWKSPCYITHGPLTATYNFRIHCRVS